MSGRQLRMTCAGLDLTLKEWAAETGLSYAVIYRRYVAMGWSPEETLTTPVGKRGGRPDPRPSGRGSVSGG